jgi:predicted dehydrogenase
MTARAGAPVRVGVIGCGTIAYWGHLRSLQRLKGTALAAAADPAPAARARAARMVHGPIYERAEDLLQSDVDAVIISTPPRTHAELTIAAARAGKHVYVEKPLATTADDAREVMDVVARSGVVAAVGFNYRHHPTHVRARALLKRRAIGKVHAVQSVFCEPGTPETMPEWKQRRESGGGALLDLASHHIDLLRWFLDDELATVDARIASGRTEHDAATLHLTTLGGIDAQTYVSFRAGPADFLEFIGEKGTLRVDRHALAPTLKITRGRGYGLRSAWMPPSIEQVEVWARQIVRPSYQPSFRLALTAFAQRIAGQPASLATIDDGARSLAVVLAAEESAGRMAPVAVP